MNKIQEISLAISGQKKISFNYDGSDCEVSPYYMIERPDGYYLIAHDIQKDSSGKHYLSNFKVDLIEDIKILDEETLSIAEMAEYPDYKTERLKMYTRDTTIEHLERLKKNLLLDPIPKECALKEFPFAKYVKETLD